MTCIRELGVAPKAKRLQLDFLHEDLLQAPHSPPGQARTLWAPFDLLGHKGRNAELLTAALDQPESPLLPRPALKALASDQQGDQGRLHMQSSIKPLCLSSGWHQKLQFLHSYGVASFGYFGCKGSLRRM